MQLLDFTKRRLDYHHFDFVFRFRNLQQIVHPGEHLVPREILDRRRRRDHVHGRVSIGHDRFLIVARGFRPSLCGYE